MSHDSVTMTVAGATVTLPAATLTRLWLEHVQRSAAVTPASGRETPRIGAVWHDQGGIYAGVSRGVNGGPDFHLILHDDDRDACNWATAKAWAAGLEAHGHSDFALPTRSEQALLYANLKERFQETWYWSGEQSSGEYAWCQDFIIGYQGYYATYDKLRARAVRRIPIQ